MNCLVSIAIILKAGAEARPIAQLPHRHGSWNREIARKPSAALNPGC
jgi:hypothetical protein